MNHELIDKTALLVTQLLALAFIICAACGAVATALPQQWALTKLLTKIGALTLRATTKVPPAIAVLLACSIGAASFGCTGTFEESRGKLSLSPRSVPDGALCAQISARARWEKALTASGAALTGASGIATWPVRSEDGKIGLAIASGVLASGTVLVLTLYEQDAAAYIEAGCATPKEQAQ